MAVYYWKRHPVVSMLALTAFLLFVVETALVMHLNMSVQEMVRNAHSNVQSVLAVVQVKHGIYAVVRAIAWALLVGAVFTARGKPRERVTNDGTSSVS